MARSTANLSQRLIDCSGIDCPDKKQEKELILKLQKMLSENPPTQKSKDALPERKITLQHVKQAHDLPGLQLDPMGKEAVSYSQYHVAKTILAILANRNAVVVAEGLEDHTPESAKELKMNPMNMFRAAKSIFRKGIPDKFEELNALQKQFLVEVTAPRVLFFLDQLTHIYQTSSKEERKELEIALSKDDYSMVFEPRERQALFWAKQAAIKSGKNHILLIFGASHNFERHQDILSKEGIEIQMSIDTRNPETLSSTRRMRR